MAVFKIPVTPGTLQRFEVGLNGTDYVMRLLWNPPAESWMMDLYDADEVPLLMGTPLVTGVDLLSQHRHLNIGVRESDNTRIIMVVLTYAIAVSPDTVPTFDNLGVDAFLYYITVPNV